jgi:nucleoid DNA-binding protein
MSTTIAKKPQASAPKTPKKSTKTEAKAPLSALDGSLPAPVAKPSAEPSVVETAQSVILGPVMRKKELIDAVVEHSGMKKKDVKPIVESMLEVLGGALAEKRELNLQPLGRIKVRRERQLPNGRMLVAKIRQANPNNSAPSQDD